MDVDLLRPALELVVGDLVDLRRAEVTQVLASSRGTWVWTRTWFGASSRVALPERKTESSLLKVSSLSGFG